MIEFITDAIRYTSSVGEFVECMSLFHRFGRGPKRVQVKLFDEKATSIVAVDGQTVTFFVFELQLVLME